MSNYKIPSISSVAITLTSIGCVDPIVGDWSLSEVCIEEECYPLSGNIGYYTVEGNMTVEEDLDGTMTVSETYNGETETVSYPVDINPITDAGLYTMKINENRTMTCTLTDLLVCDDGEDLTYSFTK